MNELEMMVKVVKGDEKKVSRKLTELAKKYVLDIKHTDYDKETNEIILVVLVLDINYVLSIEEKKDNLVN